MFLHQTFAPGDLAVIALLIVLEGVLSIDNALVLGILAKRLPKEQQKKALTYGLVGAFVFRVIAIGTAAFLLKWSIVKLLGGGYLVYIAVKHFWEVWRKDSSNEITAETHPNAPVAGVDASGGALNYAPAVTAATQGAKSFAKFWPTVVVIELTDIAFAIDSILAAIALVGPPPPGTPADQFHPKLWVVITGGLLGVILMRFAAILFIKLLERFPRFETAAYLLVTVIGFKLVADYLGNNLLNSDPSKHPVDFHSMSNPAFWIFWILMLVCFSVGFIGGKGKANTVGLETIAEAEGNKP